MINGIFKAGICPTQNLVDAYDMLATGKPIYHLEKPYKVIDEATGEFDPTQPNIDPASGYDENKPYEGRDRSEERRVG